MSIFTHVVELSSFTAAAARLGVSPSAASKAVSRLEEKLGVRLVVRSTRSVRPTEEGMILVSSFRAVMAELEDTEARLSSNLVNLTGHVRIHATSGFGLQLVAPLVSEFSAQWPLVKVDMEVSERHVSLEREAFDVAVVIGSLPDSSLVRRVLGNMPQAAVASPAYVAAHGAPKTPVDLHRHDCLGYFQPQTLSYRDWEFKGGNTCSAPSGALNYNNTSALLEAAIAGRGIAHIARAAAHDALANGQLIEVLTEYAEPGRPVSLVYLERRYQSRRVKVLVDFLANRLQADRRWQAAL